jgi:hypothetical protein
MISECAPGDDHGTESRGPHSWSGHLGDDDGTDQVDCIGGLQVINARTQQLIRRAHDRVIDDDSRRSLIAVKLGQSGTQALGIACVGLDRADLGASVRQASREVTQFVRAPGDQRDPVTSDSETAGDGHAQTWTGADQ